ncbi:hypothetical protein PG994_009997 [Apiospora phragmitis]|uniref:Uncharacterized protein n=1 Tax=Apiospora phragmitis TaxID=2905665 RepID=A0ABR1TNV1_9PEZI
MDGNQQIIRKHTAVALQKAADAAATEPSFLTGQAALPLLYGHNDSQPRASDGLIPPSQPHHPSPLPSELPFPVPRPDQAKSAALEALEDLLRAHTQPLQDERTKAEAAVAEAQEYASRLAAEIGVEQERVRKVEKEKEEQVRQLDQARNTATIVTEARRKAEQDKLDTEQILAEERQHAETLVREKAEAHEEIRRLTHRMKKLEQEIQEKSEQAEQAIEAKNEAIGRAERAESDRNSADAKALLALGLANDCCTSAKKSESLQKEERERAEEAERDLEHALQRQNEQEKEIERLRAEKARGDDTVIARGAEVITPAENMKEATSGPRRSKRRKRPSSNAYDGESEVGSSEPGTKRVAPLPNQLRQLHWAEWEGGASRLIHFDIQVSTHPIAEAHDVRPGSCSIQCVRYEEERVVSNHQIATVLEMIYRKTFNQAELSVIGQILRRHTFRTITASEYNSLFEAEVDGPIILVLWEKFPEFITEVTAGICGNSE